MSHLFAPLTLGPLQLSNRIVVAPMCQYSSVDGEANDWHVQHWGTLSQSGAGLLITEATAVEPAGRISWADLGLYDDATEAAFARALASEPRFLILDEPAGGMNDQETADLMLLIKAIQKRGITILLIEHDMNLVMRVCEKIVVLENGALIAEGTSAEIKRNPRVIEAYLGAEG